MPYPYGAPRDFRVSSHRRAKAAALIALVVQQVFSVFGRKSRFMGVWRNGWRSAFDNVWLNIGCILSLVVTIIIIYAPGHQPFMLEATHFTCWLVSLPFGIFLLFITELRKWAVRAAGPDSLIYRISDY